MYGYQTVKLVINATGDFKIINIPQMNNFKMVLTGRAPSDSGIDILLEIEGQTEKEIYSKLQQQLTNLKLYLNLYSENAIDVIAHHSPETFTDKNKFKKTILDSVDELTDVKLLNYLSQRTTQQHILLQTALEELKSGQMFNAFPKLINWLDENDGKGSSRFCAIRDSCDHGTLDRAIKKVNDSFPGEFEFEEDILKRDSQKNIQSMKKHMPEVLDHVKQVFKKKYVN